MKRKDALPFVREASHRIGSAELARRTGIALNTIENLLLGKNKYIQKQTLRKIMLELVSIKRKNEFSINSFSAWRVIKRMNGYQDVCAGCGGDLGNYTDGCETCWSRKDKRERRGLTANADGVQ